MKKFTFKRKAQDPCERGLLIFCDRMKRIEAYKDIFLGAAKLSRHEAPPTLTASNILALAGILGGTVVLSVLIICAYLSGNAYAMVGSAVIGLMGVLFSLANN